MDTLVFLIFGQQVFERRGFFANRKLKFEWERIVKEER